MCAHLYSLSEAALTQNLSVDQVGGSEYSVRVAGHDAQRLRAADVFLQRQWRRSVTGARGFINTAAAPVQTHTSTCSNQPQITPAA